MTIKDYLNNLKNSPRPETDEDRKKSAAALIDILLQEVSTPPEYEIIPEIEEWLIDICRMDKKDTLSTIDKYHFLALPTIIDMYDIVSIPSQKKYAIRNLDGAVSEYDFPALSSQFPHEISGRNKSGFDRMLKNSNRQKQKIVYRIPTNVKPIPPTEYNALNLKFLQPKLGPNPWFIDLVIKTLTGGEPGGAESMTRTILRKYRHPADRQIPWFVFSDNGGTGKGLLFEKILTKIFGRNVSNHNLSFDKISGRFSDLKGLLCALINEAPPHRTDLNFLKSIVWESEYIGEEKYQKQEVIDLYIWGGITSNPRNNRPTIMPTGNDEDRRWSFYCPDPACNTLLMSLKQYLELENIEDARLWLSDNISEYTNDDHVASWLYNNLRHYPDLPVPAFHGTYYRELISNNKTTADIIADIIFGDPNFEYIGVRDFYKMYQYLISRNGDKAELNSQGLKSLIDAKLPSLGLWEHRVNFTENNARSSVYTKIGIKTIPKQNTYFKSILLGGKSFDDYLVARGY